MTENKNYMSRLLLENGAVDVRLRSRAKDWWAWDMAARLKVNTISALVQEDEAIVIPRGDVEPAITAVAEVECTVIGIVIDKQTCYVKTAVYLAMGFPTALYIGFVDERPVGSYTVYLNGEEIEANRTRGALCKVKLRAPGDVVFRATDERLRTACYARVYVSG